MNIDTDLQWAFWDGIRGYEAEYHDYLQGQIGNPDGADKPNKKQYDPRVWLRARRGVVRRAPEAGVRRAQQRRHAGLTLGLTPAADAIGPSPARPSQLQRPDHEARCAASG